MKKIACLVIAQNEEDYLFLLLLRMTKKVKNEDAKLLTKENINFSNTQGQIS